jgi:hypothetical protein
MAKQMGKVEAVIWVIGAIVVISIVLYSVGAFDIVYNMIKQMHANLSGSS